MSAGQRPQRVRQAHVEWVAERLTARDRAIVGDVARLRVLTGSQLERLHFLDLFGRSRSVVRWRVLKRLTDWRVLVPLARKIGGATRGSAGSVYTLDTAGLVLAQMQADGRQHARRSSVPGERFIRHALTVSELYVQLVEATHTDGVQLLDYRAEPDAWLSNGLGGWLKPDAYAVLGGSQVEDHWAIEVDKATEHLPALKRQLDTYLDFIRRGQLGHHGIMPRVLITVPDDKRRETVRLLLDRLPTPAETLFRVVNEAEAVPFLVRVLRE